MSWLKRYKALSQQLLIKLVSYYDDGRYYSYDEDMGRWQPSSGPKRIVISSRRSYRTSSRKEPITDSKALRKFLSRDKLSDVSQFILGKKDGTQRAINQYIYQQPVTNLLLKSGLLCPETLILSNAGLSSGFYEVETPTDRLFITVNTQGHLDSARAVGLSSSEDKARKILGVSNDVHLEKITLSDASMLLFSGLLGTISKNILGVFVNKEKTTQKLPLDKLGLTLGIAVAGYIAFSSLYLSWSEGSREERLTGLGGQVEEAMSLEAEVKSQQLRLSAYQDLMRQMGPPIELWRLIKFFSDSDVTLNNFSVESDGVQVNVNAGSMTRLFERISDQPFVTNVEFTTSVRRSRGEETATMLIQLGDSDD